MYQISIKIFVFIYDFEIMRRVGALTFHTTANEVVHLEWYRRLYNQTD